MGTLVIPDLLAHLPVDLMISSGATFFGGPTGRAKHFFLANVSRNLRGTNVATLFGGPTGGAKQQYSICFYYKFYWGEQMGQHYFRGPTRGANKQIL